MKVSRKYNLHLIREPELKLFMDGYALISKLSVREINEYCAEIIGKNGSHGF
jgi:hypothetical protein